MPTTNPRITITLQPSVYAVLKRVAALTGNSQSALVAELLLETQPVFERMATVLEAAEKLKAEGEAIPGEIKASLDSAQARLEQQLGLVFEIGEEGYRPVLEMAERVQRRRSAAAPRREAAGPATVRRRQEPPASNRGVTPHPNKGPRQAKGTVAKPGRAAAKGRR